MESAGQNTGVGSLSLLRGIFPTQGSNPGLLHCRRIVYQLSHQGSPRILEWVAYPCSSGSSWPRNWTRVSCIAGGFFTSWATRETLFIAKHKSKILNSFSEETVKYLLFVLEEPLQWKTFWNILRFDVTYFDAFLICICNVYLPEFLIKNLKLTYHVVANFVLDASIMKSKKKQKQRKKQPSSEWVCNTHESTTPLGKTVNGNFICRGLGHKVTA